MGVCRRAALYLARKKGKSLLLFLVFFAVSALLLLCVSVVEGTGQAARELRSSVGASFTIRPYAQMMLEEGEITQAAAPVVSQESIDQILAAAQGQVRAYNTEQYGYAKSQQLHFLPGAGDNTASNMGQVTAVRDSQLLDVFREEEYTLLEGRHIQPEDSFAVLLSKELTDKNGLSVGDSVTMYDLDTDSENTFTIVGIFGGTEGMTKDAMMADGIAANQGYIDGNSYQKMWNETTLELGSLDVYVDSAQRVQQVLEAIQALPQLRGKTFTYSTDTEQFDLISTPLSSLQRMMDAAVAGIAVTGAVLAALLLLLWTRGRKREVGIFLALGKGKGEILLQFFAENLLLALPAGAAALGLAALLGERVGDILAAANGVEGLDVAVRFQDAAAVYGLGALLLALAVLLAAATVLRCKPKDILSQME